MPNKPQMILLHGALGATDQLAPMGRALESHFEVYEFGFSGHGGRPAQGPFRVEQFGLELKDWMEDQSLVRPWVLGYSLGGYVALYLESRFEGSFQGIATLATKFHWNPQQAEKEISRLQADRLEQKAPVFVEELKRRHNPALWTDILKHTCDLMRALGDDPLLDEENLSRVRVSVLTMIGDRDRMVTLEETMAASRSLPRGSLGVLPSTGHPIEALPADMVAAMLVSWARAEGNLF